MGEEESRLRAEDIESERAWTQKGFCGEVARISPLTALSGQGILLKRGKQCAPVWSYYIKRWVSRARDFSLKVVTRSSR